MTRRNSILLYASGLLFIVNCGSIRGQDPPPFFNQFKSAVVLIEKYESLGPGSYRIAPLGTGFWTRVESNKAVLVTNKHVLAGRAQVVLRSTPKSGFTSALLLIDLVDKTGKPLWVGHPDPLVDVAAVQPSNHVRLNGIEPNIISVQTTLFSSAAEIIEGDDVFFLGFPLGLRTTESASPLLRSGSVSLKPTQDFLLTALGDTVGRNIYLLDGYSIGGSSGSPVFLKPGMSRPFVQPNTIQTTQLKLVGIVSGHVLQVQPVVTQQGNGITPANAALAIVHPAEQIKQTLDLLQRN